MNEKMALCGGSFTQETIVLNLVASRGYVFQFFDKLWLLIVFSYFGNDGKGVLATGTLAFSFLFVGASIIETVANYDAHFLYKHSTCRQDRDLSKWLATSLVHIIVASIVLIVVTIVLGYVFTSVIDLRAKVLIRAQRLLWLLSPFIFLRGVLSLLVSLSEYLKRPRAIITSECVQLAIILIGSAILLFVVQLGYIGCVVVILVSNVASIVILAAANASSVDLFGSARKALQRIRRIPRQCRTVLSSLQQPKQTEQQQLSKSVQDEVIEVEMVEQDRNEEEQGGDQTVDDTAPLLTTTNSNSLEIHQLDNLNDGPSIQQADGSNRIQFGKEIAKITIERIPGVLVALIQSAPQHISPLFLTSLGTYAIGALQLQMVLLLFINFSLVYPLSVAVTTRLRAHLKADNHTVCRTTILVGLFQVVCVIGIASVVVIYTNDMFWRLFVRNKDLYHRTVSETPYALGYLLPYAINTYLCGVYRGLGRVADATGLMFVGVWVVGIPSGVCLAIITRPVYNLVGYWIGIIMGSGMTALVMFFQVICLDFKAERKRVEFRIQRHSQTTAINATSMLIDDSIAFDDNMVVSACINSFGSFSMKLKSIEEEILELEAVEFDDNI